MGFFDWFQDIGTIKNYPVTLDLEQNEYMHLYAPQLGYTPTYTLPNITLTPTMQYNPQFIVNSAGGSAIGGSISPTVTPSQIITPTVTPTQTISPTQSQQADASAAGGAGGGGIDWTTIAIVGAIGLVAFLVLTSKTGKDRVKRYTKKAYKGAKHGAKYAKLLAMAV